LAVGDMESDEEDELDDELDYWDEQFHLAQLEDDGWRAFSSLARFLLIETFEALRFFVTGILSLFRRDKVEVRMLSLHLNLYVLFLSTPLFVTVCL
jgi:hypothetical protein